MFEDQNDELKGGIDPLSPDNKLLFATSPLTANSIPGLDELYLMLLKQPGKYRKIFKRLTVFIHKIIDNYIRAGVEFMIVVEGGGTSISPKTFHDLLLPCMQDIFKPKKIPQVVYIFGSSKQIVEFLLACDPDGIILDKDCNLEQVGTILPATMPLFSECGGYLGN